ncbi:MAG: VWA domain-containing protein [Myxococcales bacterium]|nr:VWA domain-containing protein [Myxococcales bacterium]MCB9643212.1 VWA domain-containing protein [Myxococcales bacterium]
MTKLFSSLWRVACGAGLLLLAFASQDAHAQGFLIPTQRSVAPLTLKSHRVMVKITDRAAKTEVTQVFVNHTDQLLEATFLFPLPKEATLSDFVLYINGKPTRGQVLVKERAHAIYSSIVRTMRDPGLIDYLGGNLFRARVFPIPRRGEQKIKISFTQIIPFQGGLHRFVYPLKTPRRVWRTDQDFSMAVKLHSSAPLKNIYSPTHKVSVRRKSDRQAIIGFEEDKVMLDRDFVMYYSVSPKDVGINVLAHRIDEKDGYFLLMASPKTTFKSKELMGKNITFVLDTSGSMRGEKMKWAKVAMTRCLKKLNPKDHFNVIRFSTDVEGLFGQLQLANQGNIKQALSFVDKMEAAGATAIEEAMAKALAQKPRGDGVSLIVFITDGHPTVGETSPEVLVKQANQRNKWKSRIYTFGIGSSINIKLLDQIAQGSGATGDYVEPNKEIATRIDTFYDKVRYPVLSDIKLTTSGAVRLREIYPIRLPDLFRGGQLLVMGRYRGTGHAAIKLTGKVNGAARTFVYEAEFAKESKDNDFIPRLWANRKVAYLLDAIRMKGEIGELKQEVIHLAKKFGIVTPYTSYLVVEEKDRWRLAEKKEGGRPVIAFPSSTARRFRRGPRGGFRGGDDAPSARQEAAPPPPAKAAPMADAESFGAASGAGAVRVSKQLAKMKKADVQTKGGVRIVRGRRFVWRNSRWEDARYKSSMKTLKIKYLSDKYFQILAMRSDLRKAFALGSQVLVVVGKDRALIIGSNEESVSASALRSFLRK